MSRIIAQAKPVYLRKLIEKHKTVKEVADLLGLSSSNVSKSMTEDLCRFTVELAAQKVYQDLFEEEPTILMMVQLNAEDLETIGRVIIATGNTFSVIKRKKD